MTRVPWLPSSLALALAACRPGSQATGDPSASACAPAWFDAPAVDAAIAVPGGNGRILLHAAANGSQNYRCGPLTVDGGTSYAWSLVGPEAALNDCHAAPIGRHFASDAGAPEWQMLDGATVVAHKVAASTGDGRSVPWLLLSVDGHGGSGPFTEARYVQRVHTTGGVAPDAPCDASRVGTLQKVPYVADYFFYGP
jgi:hypothetical protein